MKVVFLVPINVCAGLHTFLFTREAFSGYAFLERFVVINILSPLPMKFLRKRRASEAQQNVQDVDPAPLPFPSVLTWVSEMSVNGDDAATCLLIFLDLLA